MHVSARVVSVVVALCVAVVAFTARTIHDQRVQRAPQASESGWFALDPDSLYQMRRVERALDEGLPPAATDARMNFPAGAAIPWPPYYTYVLVASVAPFASDDPVARKQFIEQRVASLPRLFGALTSVVIAAAVWRMLRSSAIGLRAAGASFAGISHALSSASLQYSALGNGDHHAWVTLLFTSMLAVAARALEQGSLDDRRASAHAGLALGALAGVLIGSWVGGLIYVVLIELALGAALFVHARRELPGLCALGCTFHAAWLLVALPAVLASPWKDLQPWMLVNLSWLHVAHPALGALVFAALGLGRNSPAMRQRWPWVVTSAVAVLAIAVAFGEFALARGVREGFAWAARDNEFMAFIAESQPLAWGQIGGLGVVVQELGLVALLAPFVALWFARRAVSELEFAPLALALPVLLAQALVQRRFADAAVPALSIASSVALATWLRQRVGARPAPVVALAVLLACVSQFHTVVMTPARLQPEWRARVAQYAGPRRDLYEWLSRQPGDAERDAVLAGWDHGHAIEWVAERPSIATNFGSYLGVDSYLDPWHFFLEDDPATAERLLESRQARYVLITGDFSKDLEVMLRLLRPETRRSYLLIPREGPVFTSQRFFTTMAARLMMGGRVGDLEQRKVVGDSLDFVRLVYVAPEFLPEPPPVRHTSQPVPAGWIWERVAGAVLELHGVAGTTCDVEIELDLGAAHPRSSWVRSGTCGDDGVLRVRVPYSTANHSGDVRALGPARCRVGERRFEVEIAESAVVSGSVVAVP